MKLSVFELIRRLLYLDLEEMRDKLAKLEKTLESTTQEKVRVLKHHFQTMSLFFVFHYSTLAVM